MKKIISATILLLITIKLASQTKIELDIPSCYFSQYHLALKKGLTLDTIAVGRFDSNGKAVFSLPPQYNLFRGVANLSVKASPINANIIINGEDKITINENIISNELIVSSPENNFLNNCFVRQSKLIEEYDKALMREQSITAGSSQFQLLNLQNQYKKYWKEVNNSPFYAARIVELLGCLSGLGFPSDIPADSVVVKQHKFLTEKLNLSDLYTSGFWELALNTWRQTALDNDSLLLCSSRKLLDRTSDMFIRRELTQNLINQFIKYDKSNLLTELGSKYLTISINGQQAPKIVVADTCFSPKLSLILFYETGCGNCHYELHQLKEKYTLLTDKHNNIRIITISADKNKDVNSDTASSFSWSDNICNLKGFNDENFINYGIIGTPTYILTDKDGIIRGRYTQLKEFLK